MCANTLVATLNIGSTVAAFREYHQYFKASVADPLVELIVNGSGPREPLYDDIGLVNEAFARLSQAERLLQLSARAQVEFLASVVDPDGNPLPTIEVVGTTGPNQFCADGVMFAECFYFMAFRFREVARLLPGFRGFEVSGIRDVRNHLLEHPKELYTNSFRFDSERGVILRSDRRSHEGTLHEDPGLVANVAQLQKQVEARVRAYLAEPVARRPLAKRRSGGS